jgi:flagellar basal-body rod modification protein FlgD
MDDINALAALPRFTEDSAVFADPAQDALGQEAFLKLLTVQLANQDPTSPVENEAFIAQLAQFSSLEQLIGLQETMDAVYLGIAAMNNSSMTSLLGKDVVAVGDQFTMDASGSATLHFDADGSFGGNDLTISVLDASGDVVFSTDLPPGAAGRNTFEWDGRDRDGQAVDEGEYSFVVSAKSDDAPVVQTLTVGRIDSMDFSQGTPLPSVNGISVGLDTILSLGDEG